VHYCLEALTVLLIALARRGFPAEIEPGTYTMRQKQAGEPLSYAIPVRSYTSLQLKYSIPLLYCAPPQLAAPQTFLTTPHPYLVTAHPYLITPHPYLATPQPYLTTCHATPPTYLRHTPYLSSPHRLLSYASPPTYLRHLPYLTKPHPLSSCLIRVRPQSAPTALLRPPFHCQPPPPPHRRQKKIAKKERIKLGLW
jgi:hypothetical protein